MKTTTVISAVALIIGTLVSRPCPASDARAKEQIRFGIHAAQNGLWREARFRFEKAAKIDPNYAAAYNNLAVSLEQLGKFDEARDAYEKALALKPKNVSIRQNFDLFRDADDKRKRKSNADEAQKNAS